MLSLFFISLFFLFLKHMQYLYQRLFFRDWNHASVIIIACDFRMYIITLSLPLCIQVFHLWRTWLETILHRCCWNYTGRSLKLESKNQEARISQHGICRLWRITLQYLVEDLWCFHPTQEGPELCRLEIFQPNSDNITLHINICSKNWNPVWKGNLNRILVKICLYSSSPSSDPLNMGPMYHKVLQILHPLFCEHFTIFSGILGIFLNSSLFTNSR